jgi:hypothetical protein
MDPSAKPDGKLDLDKEPLVTGRNRLEGEKEPLVTGHATHDDLIEKARIMRPLGSYGHGIPLFPQAMIYIILVAALAFVLFALVWNR